MCPICSYHETECFGETEQRYCRMCRNWLYAGMDTTRARDAWFEKVKDIDLLHMRLRLRRKLAGSLLSDYRAGFTNRLEVGLILMAKE